MASVDERLLSFFGTIIIMMRWSSAGESHGAAVIAIVEGMPAGIAVSHDALAQALARRRTGYGRGARQKFEQDECRFISGVRHGVTIGSPIAIEIRNSEWERWETVMSPNPVEPTELAKDHGRGDEKERGRNAPLTQPRPGHADLTGLLKYGFDDIRPVLERASARETVARVAAGYLAQEFLAQVAQIDILGHVIGVGPARATPSSITPQDRETIEESPTRTVNRADQEEFMAVIDQARAAGDTVGGVVEIVAWQVPPTLGSYATWHERLDGKLAQAMMSIPAVKGVECGDGFATATRFGSQAHDQIDPAPNGFSRPTNRAGGIEGGMSNGEPVVIRLAVKPISTVPHSLPTIDTATGERARAIHQRSDTSAVVPVAVIGEAMMALTLAQTMLEDMGAATVADMRAQLATVRARHRQQLQGEGQR